MSRLPECANKCSVGAPGSPYAAFRRAIEARNLTNVTLGEAQLVLAGLAGLRQADRQASALALIAVFAARNRPELERSFRRLVKTG